MYSGWIIIPNNGCEHLDGRSVFRALNCLSILWKHMCAIWSICSLFFNNKKLNPVFILLELKELWVCVAYIFLSTVCVLFCFFLPSLQKLIRTVLSPLGVGRLLLIERNYLSMAWKCSSLFAANVCSSFRHQLLYCFLVHTVIPAGNLPTSTGKCDKFMKSNSDNVVIVAAVTHALIATDLRRWCVV